MKHLWEVDHPYYCNEGNYYNNECGYEYETWAEFIEEMGSSDEDYNLVFRWDWSEATFDEDGEEVSSFSGDVDERNGQLSIFYMQQRKGRFIYCTVEVCRADEPAVREFLEGKAKYMQRLWAPLMEVKP